MEGFMEGNEYDDKGNKDDRKWREKRNGGKRR